MVIKKESKTSAYCWGGRAIQPATYVSPSHIPNVFLIFPSVGLLCVSLKFLKIFHVGTQIKAAESVFYSQRWKYSVSDKRRLNRKY